MKCIWCESENVTVAVAPNGFGTWICHACNESGSYPPPPERVVKWNAEQFNYLREKYRRVTGRDL